MAVAAKEAAAASGIGIDIVSFARREKLSQSTRYSSARNSRLRSPSERASERHLFQMPRFCLLCCKRPIRDRQTDRQTSVCLKKPGVNVRNDDGATKTLHSRSSRSFCASFHALIVPLLPLDAAQNRTPAPSKRRNNPVSRQQQQQQQTHNRNKSFGPGGIFSM